MIKPLTKKLLLMLHLVLLSQAGAQSNTATSSGSVGKCSTWAYPYTLYNNASASQTVNNNVTVTVDQNRNIGSVNFTGSGAMDFSGTNAITLSGSGPEINCRWDIAARGSFNVVNNNGNPDATANPVNTGVFFTAPYTGYYMWSRGSGWSASLSGAYLNGGIILQNPSTLASGNIFIQNQPGSCGTLAGGGSTPPTWQPGFGATLDAGQGLSVRAGTVYSNAPGCDNTTLTFTVGTSTVYYSN